jgi:CubicO group peptidase (beta-lactamase class C family)
MKRPLAISLTTCIAALAANAASAQLPSVTTAAARVAAIAKGAHLSGEIAIADRTGPVIDRAIGHADRGKPLAPHPGVRWLWASVTKQVTAVLVMQEVEAGTLGLDGTIRHYLPDFAGANGDTITLRQLLTHVSGLPNPDDTGSGAEEVPTFYTETGAEIADTSRATGYCSGAPKAAPGAEFAYNNCDYLVLGAILERVTGKAYAQLVADRIAKPLGLRSLRVARDGELRGGGAAIGHTTGGKPYPAVNVATFGAAGALTGTARDLVAFDRALAAGQLLGPESRAILWKGDPRLGYEAFGAWSFPARLAGCAQPVTLIERRGDVGGIQVRNIIAPDLGRSVAVFVDDDTVDFGEVWQGKGLSYDLLSAAFCPSAQS